MGKRIITQEIKDYIFNEIDRRGAMSVDEVAALMRKVCVFDPATVEGQWYRYKARRLLAQRKDAQGTRLLFAPRIDKQEYINIETCKDRQKVQAVLRQLEEKRDGLNASIQKARHRAFELEGQMSLFDGEEQSTDQQERTSA